MIGRKYELSILKKTQESNRAELGVVYGRRRVGKSFLLKSLKAKNELYFEAIRGLSLQEQIDHFCKQIAEQTKTVPVAAKSWQEAFDTLSIYIASGRWYVVLDELPWMASEKPQLVSILKYYWDNKWKQNSKLTMVLCGSIAKFMVNHVVHSEVLHNRKTFEIKLEPLPCNEAALFFKKKRSTYEITQFLMVFGGIPKYLEQLNANRSLVVNLEELCFKKGGFFVNEFETLFKEQFKVIRTYESIVRKLSEKKSTKEEIADHLKKSSGGSLTTYLSNLENSDFIRKKASISISNSNLKTKTAKYEIWDEWLFFYFRYMEKNLKKIQMNTTESVFHRLMSGSFDIYLGLAFERFCQKNIEKICTAMGISLWDLDTFGPYFQQAKRTKEKIHSSPKGTQIDLILKRKNILTIVECKFTENPVDTKVIKEVERKIEFLQIPTKYTIEKVLISASGATEAVHKEDYFNQILGLDIFY